MEDERERIFVISKDHFAIANALMEMKKIFPSKLVERAGNLKTRTKKYMVKDAPIVKGAISYVDNISRAFETLEDGSKRLGKQKNKPLAQKINRLRSHCVGECTKTQKHGRKNQ